MGCRRAALSHSGRQVRRANFWGIHSPRLVPFEAIGGYHIVIVVRREASLFPIQSLAFRYLSRCLP